MSNPTTYASARQYIGLAVETTQGTPVVPAVTMPVDTFTPQDMPTWLDDRALRGSMTEPYNRVQGVEHTEFDIAGPVYFDTIGYLLSNIFGDNVYSGTYTGSGTTTLSSSAAAGATTISTAASISSTTVIQIDTGTLSEVRTVSGVSGSGPFTLTLNNALTYAHNSAVTVKPITGPYTTVFSTLNSGNGQPSSLTITDYQGPTASTGTRAYAGCCLSELNIKGNAESSTLMYDAKGMGWPSASAAAFTSNPSSSLPQASWRLQAGLAGPASGGTLVATIGEWALNFKRVIEPIFTGQNSQNPYVIFRGKLTCSGSFTFPAVNNENQLTILLSNTQPQVQLIVTNGLSSTSTLTLQADSQTTAYTTSVIDRSRASVGYQVTWDSIANTTNAGGSGGYSPAAVTLVNNIAPNSY